MTEADLQALVDRFYAKVRADDLLGPLFNRAVEDWPEHLERLGAFWSSVMLTSGRYKGSPMGAHLRHAGSENEAEGALRWSTQSSSPARTAARSVSSGIWPVPGSMA